MPTPDITVVIPCYNAEAWVARAIDSVLAQEGVRAEVIVIDDGSTDGSVEVLKRYGDRIRWETGPNRGACAARNRGLALASAEYVMFLDADDWIEGEFLAGGLAALRERGADIGFGRLIHEERLAARQFATPHFVTAEGALRFLFGEKFLPSSTCIMRNDFVAAAGGWGESLVCRQDVELFARLLARSPRVCSWQAGHAVYGCPTGERISKDMSFSSAVCTAHVLLACGAYLRRAGIAPSETDLYVSRLGHTILLGTARHSDRGAYRVMQRVCADLGHPIPDGTRLSRLGYRLLGVRAKERIALTLKAGRGWAARRGMSA